MAFNIVARNQDDHVKNIALLMDRDGALSLSPAFDETYSWNPSGSWTASQHMSLGGKRDDFTLDDFVACGRTVSLKRGRAKEIVATVTGVVQRWPHYATQAGVPEATTRRIAAAHRLGLTG
jgi:serine/threonine-protein kinase HipA